MNSRPVPIESLSVNDLFRCTQFGNSCNFELHHNEKGAPIAERNKLYVGSPFRKSINWVETIEDPVPGGQTTRSCQKMMDLHAFSTERETAIFKVCTKKDLGLKLEFTAMRMIEVDGVLKGQGEVVRYYSDQKLIAIPV